MGKGDMPANDKSAAIEKAVANEAAKEVQKDKMIERAKQAKREKDKETKKQKDASSSKDANDKSGKGKGSLEKESEKAEKREKETEEKKKKKEVGKEKKRKKNDAVGKKDVIGKNYNQADNIQNQNDKTLPNDNAKIASSISDRLDNTKKNDAGDQVKRDANAEYKKMIQNGYPISTNYESLTVERDKVNGLTPKELEDTIHANLSKLEFYSNTTDHIPPGTFERLLDNEEILKDEWITRKKKAFENESKINGKNLISNETDNKDTGKQKSDNTYSQASIFFSHTLESVSTLKTDEKQEMIQNIKKILPDYNDVGDARYDMTGQISDEETKILNNNLDLLENQPRKDKDGSKPIYNDFYIGNRIHLQNATAEIILAFQTSELNLVVMNNETLFEGSSDAIERFNEHNIIARISDFCSGANLIEAKEIVSKWSSINDILTEARAEIAKGNIEEVQWRLAIAQEIIERWDQKLSDYTKDTIIGGERSVTTIKVIQTGADLTFAGAGGVALKGGSFVIEVGGGALLGATNKLLQNTAMQLSEVGFGLRNGMDFGMLIQKFGIDTIVSTATGSLSKAAEKWLINNILRVEGINVDITNKLKLDILSDFLKSVHPHLTVSDKLGKPFIDNSIKKQATTFVIKKLTIPLQLAMDTVIEKGITKGKFPEEKDFVEAVKKEFWKSNAKLVMKTIINHWQGK